MQSEAAAFTVIETLTAVALISTMAVVALSAVGHIRDSAAQTVCVSNLRQWGLALQLYANDHDSQTPRRGQGIQPVEQIDRPDDWFNALPPYFSLPSYSEQVAIGKPARPGDRSVFVCPAAVDTRKYPHFICYGMNMYFSIRGRPQPHRLVELPEISKLAFMADARAAGPRRCPPRRHTPCRLATKGARMSSLPMGMSRPTPATISAAEKANLCARISAGNPRRRR